MKYDHEKLDIDIHEVMLSRKNKDIEIDEEYFEKMVLSGQLPEKINEIYVLLGSLEKFLNSKKLHFGCYGAIGECLRQLKAGFISKGFEENYMHCSDVKEYLEDKEKYKAKRYGVSVDHYRKYKKFRETGPTCSARTKTGKPCQSRLFKWSSLPSGPSEFDPDKKYYCGTHEKCGEFE